MTKPLEALIADMKAAAERATPGEWWSDVIETGGTHGSGEDCMEGFHSYAVYDQNNHSLLDMTNSTAAEITVEDDGDYVMAWDEVGRRNAEYIALANPANVKALIVALEQSQAQSSKWLEAYHKAVSIGARYEERIAELEASKLAVKLPELVNFDDLDASSQDREVIQAIAECKGWNAAITAARIMNDTGTVGGE